VAQQEEPKNPVKVLPHPDAARIEREQILASAVVAIGDVKGSRAKVARDYGVERYEVTKAMQRHGEWAWTELKKQRREEARASKRSA
jgi:hypothetical protein